MADIFQWIQAATIAQDETTRAILVKLGSDIDIGDVHLLDTGDAKINPAKEDGHLDAIAKDHEANARTPNWFSKINSTPRVEGTSVNAVALAASKPYVRAAVLAMKPGATTKHAPGDNAGTVYICTSSTDIQEAWPLTPGQSMELPPCGDLSDFSLAVNNAGDGVIILYLD